MELVKLRDPGLSSYTWFWMKDGSVVSPYFDSETEARNWYSKTVE